jgi:hypothetical protein
LKGRALIGGEKRKNSFCRSGFLFSLALSLDVCMQESIACINLHDVVLSERRNLEPLDLCELVGFCVETEKPVASEKTG